MADDHPIEAPPLPTDGEATRLGRYVLVERIGAGEAGAVYKARAASRNGRDGTVAIKWFHVAMGAPAISDARVWAWLGHPNLVQVHELGESEGRPFMVMEYLEGRCLRALLVELLAQRRRLPVPLAVCVAAQVARGLTHAQARAPDEDHASLSHIEVTPSNIMVLRDGGVKLLDSGILGNDQIDLTTPESGPGNVRLSYGAPERLQGQRDRRSDLFSLGIVLWESLIGRSLFRAGTSAKTLDNVLQRVVPPPSHFRAEISPALDRLVLAALARDPEQRPESAEALANGLEATLDEDPRPALASLLEELAAGRPVPQTSPLPVVPHVVSSGPPAASRVPLHRRVSPAVVAAGLALTVVLLGAAWLSRGQAPKVTTTSAEARPRAPIIAITRETPARQAAPARPPARLRVARPPARRRTAASPPQAARAAELTLTIDPFATGEAPTERPRGLW